MKGNRYHARCRQAFDHKALDEEQRQRLGQAAPAAIFEPLDRDFDRAFICDCGSQPRQRTEAPPAAAVGASCLDFGATAAAQRLLQVSDSRATVVAEPSADSRAAAAPRRQHQIEECGEHGPRLPARVKPAFTWRCLNQPMRTWSPCCRASSAVDPAGSSSTLRAPQTNHTTPYHAGSFG